MSFEFESGRIMLVGRSPRGRRTWSTSRHKFSQIDMCRYVQNGGESFFFFDRINKINRIGVGVVYIL